MSKCALCRTPSSEYAGLLAQIAPPAPAQPIRTHFSRTRPSAAGSIWLGEGVTPRRKQSLYMAKALIFYIALHVV